ncbi:hypothetical protein RHSIM_RhsimUnG0213400 [Rhododendron simsii]|uniref:Retroviral polymerase SH3-like domain-containing protein n=1 Tax=Rhododendron simsii TaxID=118357 RepID=A0A834L251_RHOSS|nr:hypothetical protein RHSIM_RhsimUnG0213400 [Rhododendron simsii]
MRDSESLGKFDSKSDDGIFLGYSNTSRAFRVYNLRTSTLVESANVVVDDTTLDQLVPQVNDDDEGSWEIFEGEFQSNSLEEGVSSEEIVDIPTSVDEKVENDGEVEIDEPLEDKEVGQHNLVPLSTKEPSARVKLNHPISQVIGEPNDEMKTRRQIRNEINYVCFTSTLEPKKVEEALGDDYWIGAMQEELQQFVRNDVCPHKRSSFPTFQLQVQHEKRPDREGETETWRPP